MKLKPADVPRTLNFKQLNISQWDEWTDFDENITTSGTSNNASSEQTTEILLTEEECLGMQK